MKHALFPLGKALFGIAVLMMALISAKIGVASDIKVTTSWVRITLANRPAAAYFNIRNQGTSADRLLAVNSASAQRAELHTVQRNGDIMRMRPIKSLTIPARTLVSFAPGGHHVMIFGLKKHYKMGDYIGLTLSFKKAGKIMVQAEIVPLGKNPRGHGNKDHK